MKRERKRRTRVGALICAWRCTSSSRMVWPSSSAATATVRTAMLSSTALRRCGQRGVARKAAMPCHSCIAGEHDQRGAREQEQHADDEVAGGKQAQQDAHRLQARLS